MYTIALVHAVWLVVVVAVVVDDTWWYDTKSVILTRESITGFKFTHERSCNFVVNIPLCSVRTPASWGKYTIYFIWIVFGSICFPKDVGRVGKVCSVLPLPITIYAV